MKKLLFAFASAITILTSGSVSAQTISNGPYYANPSWDQQLPAAQRFIVLQNWNNEAVLDRETGLVWERQPVTNKFGWATGMGQCRGCMLHPEELLACGTKRGALAIHQSMTPIVI